MWLFIAVVLVGSSRILFGLNAKFSSEFTGGVKMTIAGNVDKSTFVDDLETNLNEQGFENTKVELDNQIETASLTVKTNVEDDVRVNELSDQLKSFLLKNEYIVTLDDILDLAITGPSV